MSIPEILIITYRSAWADKLLMADGTSIPTGRVGSSHIHLNEPFSNVRLFMPMNELCSLDNMYMLPI